MQPNVALGFIPVTLGPRGRKVAWQGLSADAKDKQGKSTFPADDCTKYGEFNRRTCGFTAKPLEESEVRRALCEM